MTKHIPLILTTALFLSACSGGNGGEKYDDPQEPEEEASIESPYEDGSGHNAGFVWAEQHGITNPSECGGNSVSFIEGCEEYANTMSSEPVDAVEAEQMGEEMPYEDGR